MMNEIQKANALNDALLKLEGEYRLENRLQTSFNIRSARLELMQSPDSAARLYDILKDVTAKHRKEG